MAIKLFIVEQTTDWNGKGEKKGTHRVQMDESEISSYVGLLDGKINLFEQNLALSVDASTVTSSLNVADMIKIIHAGAHKTIYVANSNKRPLVFKTDINTVVSTMKTFKPFTAPYSADLPKDVSVDLGNMNLL